MAKYNHATLYYVYDQLSMLGLKLNHVDKRGPGVRLNKKDSLTRYGNSHVKDKTS